MRNKDVFMILLLLITALQDYANNAAQDTTYHTLQDIVIEARADYFKIKGPNRFVYEVSKDSTLKNAMTIDALKNVPILNARNNGEVSSMNGKTLIFKINGLRDPLLSNLAQALTAIPASAIKSIEFKDDVTGDGDNVIEVNIITKGRLEGYRAQLTTGISDSKWKNGIWAMSKVRRLTFYGSYFNTWEWGHKSKSGKEEYRYATPELYRYETKTESSGYKADLHNIEAGVTYDVNDKSFLNFYGSVMLKTDPRSKSFSANSIYDQNGMFALSYDNFNSIKMKDAEYTASLKYERKDDNSAKPGHLNIGYEFYSRPFSSVSTNVYEKIDCHSDADIGFLNLYNSYRHLKKSYVTNTLVGEWKKMPSRRVLIELYGRLRTRHESYGNNTESVVDAPNGVESDYSKTTLREYFGVLTPKFLYFTDWWEIRAGVVLQGYRHNVAATGIDKKITNNKTYFLPYISGAIATPKKMTIELSYNMGNNIPDVTALDPYRDYTTSGEVNYGNPYLKSQMNHVLKLNLNGRTGKLYTGGSLEASYFDDIILSYQFVKDGLLNRTYGNIANRRGVGFHGYTSGRLHRNTYLRFSMSVDWNLYRASLLSMKNQGWQFKTSAYVEQELPGGITLDLSASYGSRPIMLQGDGSHNFSYDISFYKQFLNRKLTVIADAYSFVPLWLKRSTTTSAPNYWSWSWDRSFHASFSLTVRYSFGKLKSQTRTNSFDIENNEIKKDYAE